MKFLDTKKNYKGGERMATIATHNGHTFSLEHNRRDKRVTSKEKHIDPNGDHREWLRTYEDMSMREIYQKIFRESLEEYNSRQTRKDRQIKDYYKEIQEDKKKHIAYEMIVGVYGEDSTEQQKREILFQFAKDWQKRNPNLKMVNCSYHHDEEGKDPHIHITYIPMAQCDRGMKVQNSLSRALVQQGIEKSSSIHETPQILWEKRENAYLQQLCEERGIAVQHSEFYKGHESTSKYKQRQLTKENEKLKEENKALEEKTKSLEERVQALEQSILRGEKALAKVKGDYVDEVHQFASEDAKEHFKRELEW